MSDLNPDGPIGLGTPGRMHLVDLTDGTWQCGAEGGAIFDLGTTNPDRVTCPACVKLITTE